MLHIIFSVPSILRIYPDTQTDGVHAEVAYDEKGLIGEGTHERFIITDERFLGKAARKLEK